MITLNLLPEVKLEYLRTRRLKAKVIGSAVLVTMIAIGLVILVAGWVYGAQALQKSYLTGEIEKNAKALKAIPDIEKYLTIQNQLANLSTLHADKNDFSRLLTFLPTLNPAAPRNVTLTNIELKSTDELNSLQFQGEAKDYTGLNTFRDTLANATLKYDGKTEKLFTNVTISSSALEQGQGGTPVVTFNIDTTYNASAFLSSIKTPQVEVPQLNTTQSAQAAPDVFGQSSVQRGNQ